MKINKMECCNCGCAVRVPLLWIFGVETVFKCQKCGAIYKTGYKMGAVLFALSLTLALVTAQLAVFVFSSATMQVAVAMVIPLWLLYGVLLRRAWMRYRCRQRLRNNKKL